MHTIGNIDIHPVLYDFVEHELLPDLGITSACFWGNFEVLLHRYTPANALLLKERDALQAQIDQWHIAHPHPTYEAQKAFLQDIGYLLPTSSVSPIHAQNLDPEVSALAGPQLVVPGDNARYVLNAANARWTSLLDALYGTDMVPSEGELAQQTPYNPLRGEAVFQEVFRFLDTTFPLENGSFSTATGFHVHENTLHVTLANASTTRLKNAALFSGIQGPKDAPASVLFCHHGLHVELVLNSAHPIGKTNLAGICDVVLEAALSAIVDFEDSVAAVDVDDKTHLYRTFLGLMRGDLSATFEAKGKTSHRTLAKDRLFLAPDGTPYSLKGRALLLVRNVGLHMQTDAILFQGEPIFEGMLDGYMSVACALHERNTRNNSVHGSMYIVKPKCHGPKEIAHVCAFFSEVENAFHLPANTVKLGIMDEERRTSVNLSHCIDAAKERVFFINTGFLDRTGDEIHTCMTRGAVLSKEGLKKARWLGAYEAQNVAVGLASGFAERAQIGKGMWTLTEKMRRMVEEKIAHVQSGASTAWVPSPVAACLHALHYHAVEVRAVQQAHTHDADFLEALLTPPLQETPLSEETKQHEVENAIQSILGYVVRWVDQGIGCSKVLDRNNEALMEDRATLRISSQLLANWLHHGLISKPQTEEAFEAMAVVVDAQNANDPKHRSLLGANSVAMKAAKALVYEGAAQPNGYTEFILHAWRKRAKEN
ncbi:MAG: malate synthase G [Campylobacterales bacterium]|nr:malate synthase G [Campylobacterales bacterium]